MQVSRRSLLMTTPLAALALAGCAVFKGHTVQQNVAQISSDVSDIATALKNAIPQVAVLKGLPSAVLANIESAVADLQAVAQQVAAAAASAAQQVNQTVLSQVETDVNAFVNGLVGISLPDALAKVVQAVSVLLPVVLQMAGMLTIAPKAGPMSPDVARATLRTYRSH